MKHGYKINVKYGYNFDKQNNVFTYFVTDLYKTKAESPDKIQRNISKSILNNLIGRFGMNINKPITSVINDKTLDMLDTTRNILNTIVVSNDRNLTTFEPNVSKHVCDEFGVDYIKALEADISIKGLKKDNTYSNVNVAISAAVNAYARIYMGEIKLDLISKGYTLYYTDTDSLVIDKPLDSSLVGTELGKFKLEYLIDTAYFISSKLYCLIYNNETKIVDGDESELDNVKSHIVTKGKGGNNSVLTALDFHGLLFNDTITGIKRTSKINYSLGTVEINDQPLAYNPDCYKNRVKIYNKSGM